MKKVAIIISPNWRGYAEKYLADCLASLRAQDYQGQMKLFLADNETSVESVQFLQKAAPEVELVLNQKNDGFAKGNNDAMRLALAQGFEYIILFNMDTIVAPDCVRRLAEAAEKNSRAGAVQARLMLWPDQMRINSLGNVTHFLGFGYSEGYRKKLEEIGAEYRAKDKPAGIQIFYPSGAGVLFTREALLSAGLYDEEYWMYNEDQEHGWRLRLVGFECILAMPAVVYHKYEFGKSIKQFYWLDRNRILAILECYSCLTLLFIFPAFIVMEAGLILFSIKSGWAKEKIRVWLYFLSPKNWAYIRSARKRNQALRRIKDKDIAPLISGRIWYQEVDDWKLRLINPVFELYWRMVRRVMFW